MKNQIALIIIILIMITFLSCTKSNNPLDTSSKSTTQSETTLKTTKEIELTTTQEVTEDTTQTSEVVIELSDKTLFDDNNSECDYANYKEESCTTFTYNIKVKYPDNWGTNCLDTSQGYAEWPNVGIQVFNEPLPEYFEPIGGTVFVSEYVTDFKNFWGYEYINEHFNKASYEYFTTSNGYKTKIYYFEEDEYPGYIQFLDYSSLCVFLDLEETQDIKQIVNIINSIEITKLEENN